MKMTPHLVSITELLAELPPTALQVKPLQKIAELLEGKVTDYYGIIIMPYRLLPFLQQYKGEQHTGDRILFTSGNLFWFFHRGVTEPTFIEGKDLPSSTLEHFTLIGDSLKIAGTGIPDVAALNCVVVKDGLVVPGWEYVSKSGETYEVELVGNADRDPTRHKEYPLTVAYRSKSTNNMWAQTLGDFIKRKSLVMNVIENETL
jgi:hypothetical protein